MGGVVCLADAMDGGYEYIFYALGGIVSFLGFMGLVLLSEKQHVAAMLLGFGPLLLGIVLFPLIIQLFFEQWETMALLLPEVPLALGLVTVLGGLTGFCKGPGPDESEEIDN